MPIHGDLRTLPLPGLLRLLGSAQKTGVLEVERKGISRRIEFRKGHVGSCSSNDPSSRLGQFLLSRGRVNETQLQHLLTLQKATGKRLGLLLVEMGIVSRQELTSEVASKARETIHGLFDWGNAYFRFDDGATLDPDQIEVALSVEELIAEGQERTARLSRIREVFESSGAVLVRTERAVPDELFEWPFNRRMLESVDGQRSIAEVVLHARASEFVMLDFLTLLYERGLLEIREVRPAPDRGGTLLDADACRREPTPAVQQIDPLELEDRSDAASVRVDANPRDGDLVDEIEQALRLMERQQYEAAVELLRASCLEHATDYARHLLLKAETAVVDGAWKDTAFGSRFPVLLRDRGDLLAEEPPPDEAFLLSLIDGTTDVQAILWLTPMREVDVIIALKRMVKKGMIELAEPSTLESPFSTRNEEARSSCSPTVPSFR